eukprot:4652889-Pleurochrysis_carterae.AAC.3
MEFMLTLPDALKDPGLEAWESMSASDDDCKGCNMEKVERGVFATAVTDKFIHRTRWMLCAHCSHSTRPTTWLTPSLTHREFFSWGMATSKCG